MGEGMPYFRRSSHAALLVGAALLTYGIGGLVYWLVKRGTHVCPSCGLSWDRSGRLDPGASVGQRVPQSELFWPQHRAKPQQLPRGGLVRRVLGVCLALLAVLLFFVGVVESEAGAVVAGVVSGLAGGASFAWGWIALQRRREGLLGFLQTQVLRVASARGGRLTATDVASDLGVTLPAAERVLFAMDDGFRVSSDVTDEGLLVFDFPEIRVRSLSAGGSRSHPTQDPKMTED